MENQNQPSAADPLQNGAAVAENAAAHPALAAANDAGGAAVTRTFSSVLNAATGFMSLAGREWFGSLLYQPMDPPFKHDARFEKQLDRVIRLVVVVIVLTGIVVGGVGLIADKSAALSVVTWAMKVLIVSFLVAIAYGIFAFICGVRVCDGEQRRKLTVAQILFTILYIFVPWIPIVAFLRSTAPTGGPFLLLILTLFFYLCLFYMILNFAKALKRLTNCSRFAIWLSILLPIFLILLYLISRPADAA